MATVASPIALGTSLLYYFGWVRARSQARAMGYDISVLSLTPADYVIKSVTVLFVPTTLLIIAFLLLQALHRRWVLPVVADPGRAGRTLRRLTRLLTISWLLWFAVAVAMLAVPSLRTYALPVALTMSLCCALYGRALNRARIGSDPWSPGARILVFALLSLALFWDAERIARTIGQGFAAEYNANPRQLAAVVLYANKDLAISGPGITVKKLAKADSEYSYRYTGLRLLERSGDRYLLLSESPQGRQSLVYLLKDSDKFRLEFVPG